MPPRLPAEILCLVSHSGATFRFIHSSLILSDSTPRFSLLASLCFPHEGLFHPNIPFTSPRLRKTTTNLPRSRAVGLIPTSPPNLYFSTRVPVPCLARKSCQSDYFPQIPYKTRVSETVPRRLKATNHQWSLRQLPCPSGVACPHSLVLH